MWQITKRILQEDATAAAAEEYYSSGNQALKTLIVIVLFVCIAMVGRTIYKNLKETGSIIATGNTDAVKTTTTNKEAELV